MPDEQKKDKISTAHLTFKNRIIAFVQDIEMVDILCTARGKNDLLNSDENLFKYFSMTKHVTLSKCAKTENARKIIICHLRQTVHIAFIKEIFEELNTYLKNLLYQAALISREADSAGRLLGEHKITFNSKDLLQFETKEALFQEIASKILQSLEQERNTGLLVKKISDKIGLDVDQKYIDKALPYLELRHLLVHNDNKASEHFKKEYPNLISCDEADGMSITYKTVKAAKDEIAALVAEIDKKAIAKRVLKANN